MNMIFFLIVAFLSEHCLSFSPPKPTEDILAWTKREIGMMYSFDMVSFYFNTNFCGGTSKTFPPREKFDPIQIDMDNWLQAASYIGAKYAVLVAQHCTGFSMWPTDIKAETGFDYTYSIKYSPLRAGQYDIVKEFVTKCKEYNILPGIYYGLNVNYYLNMARGSLIYPKPLEGQASVSQELYGKIILAQMKELWTNYGTLAELWFDGGCSPVPGVAQNISDLLEKLQPHAVYFNACGKDNNIRWVETESGLPPYPIWSNSNNCASGGGSATGNTFCPAESDTTLGGSWFWGPLANLKTLQQLKADYFRTVGQNTNLLLNAAPNPYGVIDSRAMKLYKEFGQWISECFNKPIVSTNGTNSNLIKLGNGQSFEFNIIVIQEDQTNGQLVTEFTVYDGFNYFMFYAGTSIGNKLIIPLDETKTATELVLDITDSFMEPVISHFAVYNCNI